MTYEWYVDQSLPLYNLSTVHIFQYITVILAGCCSVIHLFAIVYLNQFYLSPPQVFRLLSLWFNMSTDSKVVDKMLGTVQKVNLIDNFSWL